MRRWAEQLRTDLMEVLGYRLVTTADTARLQRAQDGLDATRPALTRAGRPFDRRRYAYLVLTLAALGRHGAQVALGELADAVAADAVRIDGLGLDTARKPDRDAFVDAVTWLTERGALTLADGSATAWAGDPERAEALYDIDREILLAVHHPTRVLQHLTSVTALLDSAGALGMPRPRRPAPRPGPPGPPSGAGEPGRVLRRRRRRTPGPAAGPRPRRGPGAADRADGGAAGRGRGAGRHLRQAVRPPLPRRRHGRAGRAAARRPDQRRRAALRTARPRTAARAHRRRTPRGPRPADRRRPAVARTVTELTELTELAEPGEEPAYEPVVDADQEPGETRYPFVTDSWLRGRLKEIIGEYGAGFAADLRGDPDRLLDQALDLLAAMSLIVRVDGGALALPLLARYRGVTARVKTRTARSQPPAQTALFDDETAKDPTP